MHRISLLSNLLNFLRISNRYGVADSWIDLSLIFVFQRIRIPAHIPGLCGTLSKATICVETNLSDIEGVAARKSRLRIVVVRQSLARQEFLGGRARHKTRFLPNLSSLGNSQLTEKRTEKLPSGIVRSIGAANTPSTIGQEARWLCSF